ncbi:MAG: GNAT family N-acetyltransferase [Roseiflexaceae bacterium]|nr:GNAT family N-acetyltransferase [Roseiflexaceae bacterium]
MQIAVLPAEKSHSLLLRLMQFYLYDLSEHELADIGPDGHFADGALRAWLAEPSNQPFLFYNAGQPIGFAFVGCNSHQLPVPDIYTISAFFILRRYRRQGLGRKAAYQLFERFPGRWEIATLGANTQAISFWRSVVDTFTNGLYDEIWHQDNQWRGSVQVFTVPKKEA